MTEQCQCGACNRRIAIQRCSWTCIWCVRVQCRSGIHIRRTPVQCQPGARIRCMTVPMRCSLWEVAGSLWHGPHFGGACASVQGSVFSAVLGELLDAVRWPHAPPDESPRGSPKPSPAPSQGSSPSRISALRSHTATATLAAHPYRPLYLSGARTCRLDMLDHSAQASAAMGAQCPAVRCDGQALRELRQAWYASTMVHWRSSKGIGGAVDCRNGRGCGACKQAQQQLGDSSGGISELVGPW